MINKRNKYTRRVLLTKKSLFIEFYSSASFAFKKVFGAARIRRKTNPSKSEIFEARLPVLKSLLSSMEFFSQPWLIHPQKFFTECDWTLRTKLMNYFK